MSVQLSSTSKGYPQNGLSIHLRFYKIRNGKLDMQVEVRALVQRALGRPFPLEQARMTDVQSCKLPRVPCLIS